ACLAQATNAFGLEDHLHLGEALLDVVVDDDVVVGVPVADFGAGAVHAVADDFLAVGAARAQALLERLDTRRQQEYAHDVALRALIELLGPLPVDVEQEVVAALELLADLRLRGAVAMAEDLGPLEERVFLDHPVESRAVGEMVVVPVDLAG